MTRASELAFVTTTQLPLWFQLTQIFASPIATLIAATVAAYFVRAQWKTAAQQAEIAKDQLRWNLFSKRYEIYKAASDAITLTIEKMHDDHYPQELNILFVKFAEARFFFPNDISLFLDQLRKDILTFLSVNNAYRRDKEQNEQKSDAYIRGKLLSQENNIVDLQAALYSTRSALPTTFGDALNFPQLTSPAAAHRRHRD